jgi:3-dehydroquinate synthase
MESITIKAGTGISVIHVGHGMGPLEQYLPSKRAVLLTDDNVFKHHSGVFGGYPVIQIGHGEGVKTLETVTSIYRQLIDLEADRSTFLVGIGGGVVCDICGFVASTYMRGVSFGFVATTLLAQVDASVGGKNGVNFGGYKNMVGVFNQPEFVVCDSRFLSTLPKHELHCGLAEVVKHGAISDADYFAYLEQHAEAIVDLDRAAIKRVVADSVRIKAAVVERDEKEAGERRKLNFGHTLGHALEKTLNVSHGQAVSAGMAFAARLSVQMGRLESVAAERLVQLLKRFDLPVAYAISGQQVIDAIGKDKKRQHDTLHFVLLRAIGQAVVENMPLNELARWVAEIDIHPTTQ